MLKRFFVVSVVRKDGGVSDTTFIGYAAEGIAFTYAGSLENKPNILFVSVIERTVNRFGGDFKWETRRIWSAHLQENAKSAD